MGHLRRLSLVLAVMLLGAGCANKKRSLEVPFKPAPVVKREPPAESFYTPDRQLVGSPVRVEWLEIPLAFRPTGQDFGRHHLFEARAVGLQVARDFFSQRMLSGMAEETPGSVFYGAVMPPSGGDAVRLHVRLTQRPLAGVLELDVESLRGDDTKPLSVEEARRALAAEQKHAH